MRVLGSWFRPHQLIAPLLLGVGASSVTGQDVPTGPPQPASSAECVDAFAAAFSRHFRDDVCRPCHDFEGFPGTRWSARYMACFKDCIAVKRARFDALTSARSACFARAMSYANEQEQEKLRTLEGMKASEKLATAFGKAIKAYEAVNDPRRFFHQALKALPDEARRRLGDAHHADPMTVEAQVHAFTANWAKQGVNAASQLRVRSDVIAAIQRDALERIVQVHQSALDDLDVAMDEANQTLAATYGAPASSFRPPPIRTLSPSPRARPARESADCSVLSTRESAELANDDPDQFEELTRRCGGAKAGNR